VCGFATQQPNAGGSLEDTESLKYAYASEIITNSEITVVKLRLFEFGFCITVVALVLAGISALLKQRA